MEFRDLKTQYEILKDRIDENIATVISTARFIGGPMVRELEKQLADYVGVKHCISCGNGTDAITLALMTWNIGKGDAVFVPDFTFFSSGECPALSGATPIYVDVEQGTYNLDPEKLEDAIIKIKTETNLKPRVVIAVDLFGLPADYKRIRKVCDKYELLILEDGAQGFGGSIEGKMACSFGDISTTSFFPAKPLGCYGDGGAVFTNNDEWGMYLNSIVVHGKSGEDKYNNIHIGMNSRLDSIQAAVLLPKLNAFKEYELKNVNRVANWYTTKLKNSSLTLPFIPDGFTSSWAQYTVQLPYGVNREGVQKQLKEDGIPTMVYYMKPMHSQAAFRDSESAIADCPVTERLCERVISLPMHPYMTEADVNYVVEKLLGAVE